MSRAIHRREFLKVSIGAGGGLLLGFRLAGTGETLAMQNGSAASFTPNAFVRIGTDERVTVIVNHSEMGQGVYTSLPMLLAEELDADWNNVAFESAPVDPKYNHPVFGMQMTEGSSSVWSGFEQFRQAGAAARAMLIAAAAQQWNVDPSRCRTDSGAVFDPSNHKLTYGQRAAAAAKLTPPAQVPLKDPTTFKLIGKPAKRLDTSEKVNGTVVFGVDVKMHGMMTAVVARAPIFGAKVRAFDDSRARSMSGVHRIVAVPSGVAVFSCSFFLGEGGREAPPTPCGAGALPLLHTHQKRGHDRATGQITGNR